jgi:hypothetical protein
MAAASRSHRLDLSRPGPCVRARVNRVRVAGMQNERLRALLLERGETLHKLAESLMHATSQMAAPGMRRHSPCQRRDPLCAAQARRARWFEAALAGLTRRCLVTRPAQARFKLLS